MAETASGRGRAVGGLLGGAGDVGELGETAKTWPFDAHVLIRNDASGGTALESAAIAGARLELAGFYLARLPAEVRGGVELWLCFCGVRR